MPLLDEWIRAIAALIEIGGSLLVVFRCGRGLHELAPGRGSHHSIVAGRLAVAEGIVAPLGIKMAATLLKTIEPRSWNAIQMFAAVFVLRTFVKQALAYEEECLKGVYELKDSSDIVVQRHA